MSAKKGRYNYKWVPWLALGFFAFVITFMVKGCGPKEIATKASAGTGEGTNVNVLHGNEILENVQQQLSEIQNKQKAEEAKAAFEVPEPTPSFDPEEKKKLDDLSTALASIQQSLDTVSRENAALREQLKSDYHIQSELEYDKLTNFTEIVPLDYQDENGSLIKGNNIVVAAKKPSIQPVYTLQPSMLLKDAILETGIFAQVPNVGNQVRTFYPFYVETGSINLASQGYILPEVVESRWEGVAVGNGTIGCAEGYITKVTFTFADGTFWVEEGSRGDPLGIITAPEEERGYPCVRGEYITNAPQYLGIAATLAGFDAAANAFANAQTTTQFNNTGGSRSSVTGSNSKFAFANTISGASDVAVDYARDRLDSTFDIVIVENKRKIDIRIQKVIEINYDPNGRRLNHLQAPTLVANQWWDLLQ